MAIFEQYPAASWEVGSSRGKIVFPVCDIQESGGNRIVERERPYRDGAKLDDIGRKAIRWTVVAKFENSIQEEGLSTTPLYPTVLNNLLSTFDVHATGDLTLPTRGKVRARAESYQRKETTGDRDYATVTLVFCEDNEDSVDAQTFESPSVNASARRITEQAEFDAESGGFGGTSMADLREFGSQLEGLANAPGETLNDLDTQASIVVGTVNRTTRSFSRADDQFSDPENSRTQRKLEQTKDLAGRSRRSPRAGRPRIVSFKLLNGTSLFNIAAQLRQPAKDIIDINPTLNPLFVPAGTVVRVFENP